jgi:hypothetical protein
MQELLQPINEAAAAIIYGHPKINQKFNAVM